MTDSMDQRRSIICDTVRLRDLRSTNALTQQDLALRADISVRTVHNAERGIRLAPQSLRALADALGVEPRQLLRAETQNIDYQSAFLSYGGPDEPFARRLYNRLHDKDINVYFFAESAIPGKRLHRTMAEAVYEYDRVILVCSQASLTRSGVLNEIEQVLAREATEGGTELLIPVAIDDYVFVGWSPDRPDIANQIRSRVIADFRGAVNDDAMFQLRFDRLLLALENPT